MDDLAVLLRKLFTIALLFIAVCLVAALFLPPARPVLAGLALGTAASLAISWNLGYHTKRFANHLVQKSEKKQKGFGYITRVCIVILAAMIAVKLHASLVGLVAGLVFIQFGTILYGIFSAFKNH